MAIRQITFNYKANGGSGAPSSSTDSFNVTTVPYTKTKKIASAKPSRTYYNFLGWGSSAGATSATWASSQTLSFTWASLEQLNVEMNFYAVWQHQTAYVNYNANGGTGAPSTQSHWAGYSVTLSSTRPTRDKYIFIGWSQSSTATTASYQPNTSYALYNTVTLYAVWKKASDTVSALNGTIGNAITLTITKIESTYADDITYSFGNVTGTIASGTTSTSISWTPPLSLASEIPNASSGTLVITCATYSGSSLVGTTTTSVSLTVPQSMSPTASVSYVDTDATCLAWGIFVQSRSKLSYTVTASGQYGATITSYSAQVNGSNYTSATWTTDVLLYSGSNTYTVKVTDSRGYQTTVTGTFSVESYSTPSVSLVSCDRDDSDPDQVDIVFDFAVASVQNNNSALYSFDYKEKSASNWTRGSDESLGSYSGSISDFLSSIDQGSEYDIRINVKDAFQTVSTETEVGVSGNVLFNQRHRGGLGLLMKSQSADQLDVGKPSVFHGKVKEMFGSTVGSHSASGNYAKILTFGTNAQTSANFLAPMVDGTYSGNGVTAVVSNGVATLSGTTTASGNAIIIPLTKTITVPANSYIHLFNSDANGSASPSFELSTSAGTTNIAPSFNPANRIFPVPSNRFGVTIDRVRFWLSSGVTLSGTFNPMIAMSSTAIPFEPYTDASDLNINSPITLEYIKTGDSAPTRLTITFNRDFSLASYTKDASADAYLVNSATATWDLYIGKSNTSDKVEILDFHDPWSNTDLTVDWEETSVSTLPTGAVSATPVNTVMSESPSGVSVASATWKTTAEITLPRGIWVLSGYIQFNSNTTGIRSAVLSASRDSGTSTRNMSSDTKEPMTGGNATKLHFFDVYQVASETTYYLNAYQNCGSALTIYGRITAIKIV